MIYRVRHTSDLTYASAVQHAQFNLRLSPWAWAGHRVLSQSLTLTPEPASREEQHGPYCVRTTHVGFARPITSLKVASEFTIALDPPSVPNNSPSQAQIADQALAERDISVLSPAPYLFASRIAEMDDTIGRWAETCLVPGRPMIDNASALMAAIHTQFAYVPGATDSATAPADAFRQRRGVCQDFAHVMIIALRAHSIPAAYVSGYLRTVPPPGRERLVGADAMHAWVHVWCGPELGWIGFDPTNNCIARADHIVIGMGRDYADISPIDGTFIGSSIQTMRTAVDVVEVP